MKKKLPLRTLLNLPVFSKQPYPAISNRKMYGRNSRRRYVLPLKRPVMFAKKEVKDKANDKTAETKSEKGKHTGRVKQKNYRLGVLVKDIALPRTRI